jgi:hypothetical protein
MGKLTDTENSDEETYWRATALMAEIEMEMRRQY